MAKARPAPDVGRGIVGRDATTRHLAHGHSQARPRKQKHFLISFEDRANNVQIALSFRQRMILDGCKPYIQYTSSSNSSSSTQTITGFTITSTDNMCEMAIPVTYPGKLADTKDFRVEQIGTDPATIWVYLMGEPQSFELANPITV